MSQYKWWQGVLKEDTRPVRDMGFLLEDKPRESKKADVDWWQEMLNETERPQDALILLEDKVEKSGALAIDAAVKMDPKAVLKNALALQKMSNDQMAKIILMVADAFGISKSELEAKTRTLKYGVEEGLITEAFYDGFVAWVKKKYDRFLRGLKVVGAKGVGLLLIGSIMFLAGAYPGLLPAAGTSFTAFLTWLGGLLKSFATTVWANKLMTAGIATNLAGLYMIYRGGK